ncbi:MAG: hypothetical protein K2F95_01445 [Alistipes sp.]|nr:hypothetical protein [Alistipes sp.]
MALEQIKSRLERLNALIERWNDNDISPIERDLALEHLRVVYDEVSSIPTHASVVVSPPSAMQVARPEPNEDAAAAGSVDATVGQTAAMPEPAMLIDDPIDIDMLLGLSSAEEESETILLSTDEPEITDDGESGDQSAAGQIGRIESVEPEPMQEDSAAVAEEPEPLPEPAAEQPAEEPVAEETADENADKPAEEPEPLPEPANEQPSKTHMGGLFDISEIPVRSKRRRNVMISLYEEPARPLVREDAPAAIKSDAPAPAISPLHPDAVTAEPEPGIAEPETAAEAVVETLVEQPDTVADAVLGDAAATVDVLPQPADQPADRSHEPQQRRYTAPVTPKPAPMPRLADVLGGEVTTLADSMIAEGHMPRTAATGRIDDLRKAIGINDKFLMIRDLFNGDGQMFEDTITTLNEFDDLDECMIYIVENFAWNPDSDGAQLLMALIERKLA